MRALWLGLLLTVGVLPGCGIDPGKVPTHEVFAKDGGEVRAKKHVTFAVVGATRSVAYGAKAEPEAPVQLVADVRSEAAVRGIDAVVLTGGYVRRSTPDEWSRFGRRWKDVIDNEMSSENQARKPVLALVGDGEMLGDRRLSAYGAAFPGAGAGIGFNRNASWGKVDVNLGKVTWRILMLDTHQKALGSRWQEQLFWLPNAVSEGEYDRLVVFMSDPRVTLADGARMDPGDGPTQLIDIIEEYAGIDKLVAIVSGGPRTNELLLPTGTYGEAYVVAGNSGVDMPTLMKAGAADEAGFKDVGLEPLYVTALQQEFTRQADTREFSENVIDQSLARGDWETYIPRFDGGAFPVQGWWIMDLAADSSITLTFRMRRPDGTFFDLYSLRRGLRGGWATVSTGK